MYHLLTTGLTDRTNAINKPGRARQKNPAGLVLSHNLFTVAVTRGIETA